MRKFLRRTLYGLAGLIVFWALVHGVEWIHGRWTRAAWIKERQALGGAPSAESLVPPPIPDEENFARAPIVVKVLGFKDSPFSHALKPPEDSEALGRWKHGKPADLAAIARANGCRDLLEWAAPLEVPLRELDAASRRRGSRLYRSYEPGGFGHPPGMEMLNIRAELRILFLRSLALQKAGRADAALEDILTSFRILEHLGGEPDFSQNIILQGQAGFPMQAVWEGLVEHRWGRSQLETLQHTLERTNVLARFQRALAWDRLVGQRFFHDMLDARTPSKARMQWERRRILYREWAKASDSGVDPESLDPTPPSALTTLAADALMPAGWIVQNQVRQDQVFLQHLLRAVDPPAHRIDAAILHSAPAWWKNGGKSPYTFFAAMIPMEWHELAFQGAAREQTWIDLAVVAIALERHRLDHGGYPESLSAVVPAYLSKVPNQVLIGEPVGYLRSNDGSFHLWAKKGSPKSEDNTGQPTGASDRWTWPALPAAQIENRQSKIEN